MTAIYLLRIWPAGRVGPAVPISNGRECYELTERLINPSSQTVPSVQGHVNAQIKRTVRWPFRDLICWYLKYRVTSRIVIRRSRRRESNYTTRTHSSFRRIRS